VDLSLFIWLFIAKMDKNKAVKKEFL
jgi:hypothetical protein